MLLVTSSLTSSIMDKINKSGRFIEIFSHFMSIFVYLSCLKLLCMLLIVSSRTSSIRTEEKSKWPIFGDFSHFTLIILLCGHNSFYSYPWIYPPQICNARTNNQFSDKFNNGGGLLSSVILFNDIQNSCHSSGAVFLKEIRNV